MINPENSPEYFYEGSIFKSANKKTAITLKNPEAFDLKSSAVSSIGQYIKFKVYKAEGATDEDVEAYISNYSLGMF